jgi:hypothetical protein
VGSGVASAQQEASADEGRPRLAIAERKLQEIEYCFGSPFRLAELERLLRHCLLVMKATGNADRSGNDKSANDKNAHGSVPQFESG